MEGPRAPDENGPAGTAGVGSKNISVFCRLKPLSFSDETPSSFVVQDGKTIRIKHPIASGLPHVHGHKAGATKTSLVFTYDRVYDENASQKDIFEGVGKPLVEAVCNGLNATVLAYGTTASGKTYTILGPRGALASGKVCTFSGPRAGPASKPQGVRTVEPTIRRVSVQGDTPEVGAYKLSAGKTRDSQCKTDDLLAYNCQGEIGGQHSEDGLLPRMIFYMFHWLERKTEIPGGRLVKAAAMEVYNDSIVDLATGRRGLKIHKPKTGQVSIVGLHEEALLGPEAAIAFLGRVVDLRKTAATNANAESSRSHFVFWLILHAAGSSTTARLSVVDLAGSERLVKTNTRGGTQVEGAMINQSITCLGKVISCLASFNEAHREHASGAPEGYGEVPCSTQQCRMPQYVPYRDSKLTRLLQDSLGGNSHTSIVLTCSQEVTHLTENIPTLRFGQRARNVKNSPKQNEVSSHEKYELQKDISRYQNYIRELASWGETAIVKLTDRARSATGKLCGSQSIPLLRKTGGLSRRTRVKRATTSTSGFLKDCDGDDTQAGVVDELLSGFPAPPKALHLDFIKDDVAMNIRHRLQQELVSNTRVDERHTVTNKPDYVATRPTQTEFDGLDTSDFLGRSCDAYPHSVDRTADAALPAGQNFTRINLEEEDDFVAVLEKETVADKETAQPRHAGLAQVSDTSGGCNRASSASFATLCCDVQPESVKNRQTYSLPPNATPTANGTRASTASCTCEILQEQCDVPGPQRAELRVGQRQDDDGRISYLRVLSCYSKTDGTVQQLKPVTSVDRQQRTGRVTPTRANRARPEVGFETQLAPRLKLPSFWKAATSWVSHMKGLQALVPGRAGKLEVLRRATQVDDAIRIKQKLLL